MGVGSRIQFDFVRLNSCLGLSTDTRADALVFTFAGMMGGMRIPFDSLTLRAVVDEVSELRLALAARIETCWERLDNAVSELVSLHEVSPELIIARVSDSAASEAGSNPVV